MHARNDTLDILVDLSEDRRSDASHDAHVYDSVCRISKLNADLGHWRTDWAHRERKNVHGPSAHRATKELLQLTSHNEGIFPVIGRAGIVLRQRANKGTVFNAGNIVWCRPGVEAARPQLLIQLCESSRVDQLPATSVV